MASLSEDLFLAEAIHFGEKRIIKRFKRHSLRYDRGSEEARILGRLHYTAFPMLYDVEEDESYFYIIEEYIEGMTLFEWSETTSPSDTQVISVLTQLCEALIYLHGLSVPILYLDLKPENIIISASGKVSLIDFDSAVFADNSSTFIQRGTKGFSAPEMFTSGKVSEKCDIYSLGCIAYFLITKSIFTGSLQRLSFGNRALYEAVRASLSLSPYARPSAAVLLKKLKRAFGRQVFSRKIKRSTSDRKLIGLLGTHSGVGTTFISLLLSHFIAEETHLKTVYVEFNHHGDCLRFLDTCRTFTHVSYYAEADSDTLTELLSEDHCYYIIDFGCDPDRAQSELIRCDEKIIVTQAISWKLHMIQGILKEEAAFIRQKKWHCFLNLSNTADEKLLTIEDGYSVDRIRFENDIYHPSRELRSVFETLL